MATPEIGVEQEDGRWNESSGDYTGEGINAYTLFSTGSFAISDLRQCMKTCEVFIFIFHFLC